MMLEVRPEVRKMMQNDPFGFAGKTFDENLEVQEYVDAGGMAIVYRAWHKGLATNVALKILKPEHTHKHPELAEKFRTEGVITHSLQANPHIVRVIDAKTIRANDSFGGMEHACLVMEWLDGRTLREEIESRGPLSRERILKLFEQLCKGIAYAHANNVVHLDLKPGNIMLVRKNETDEMLKILDFGLARMLTPDTLYLTSLILTPEYSAPEQLEQGKVGIWSDIYSLGVILYQMFCGKVPFDGESVVDVINQVVNDPPPPPTQRNPAVPLSPVVEAVILKALEKKPEHRYQTAMEFAEALRKAIASKPGRLSLRCYEKDAMNAISGACVYLNEEKAGETDEGGELLLDGLQPDEYVARIEHIDHQHWTDRVKISSDGTTKLSLGLERKPFGSLLLACRDSRTDAAVSDAVISLDGDHAGRTNESGNYLLKTILSGKHQIRIAHPEYPRVVLEVDIATGGFDTQQVFLQPNRLSQARKKALGIGAAVVAALTVAFLSWYFLKTAAIPATSPSFQSTGYSARRPVSEEVTKNTSPVSVTTNLPKELIEKGEQLAKAGRHREALNSLKKALKLKPEDPFILNGLAIVAANLGDSSFRKNEFTIAEQAYGIALQFWSNDATTHHKLGDTYTGLKRYEKAIQEYTNAINLGRTTAETQGRLGDAYFRAGKYDDARIVYQMAMEMDGTYKPVYQGLERTYLKLNLKEAAQRIQRKLQLLDREPAKIH
jgi:serine/threonine protein kinase/Flp pilus assembly protein TadD